jgi:hypothetical protein
VVGKRGRRVSMVPKCVPLYVIAKMIFDETIPGMGEGEVK